MGKNRFGKGQNGAGPAGEPGKNDPESDIFRGNTCFLDRELSWLRFEERLLKLSGDSSLPILERLRFLDIYHKNLNEFYTVRVGALLHRAALLPREKDGKTGWTAARRLKEIARGVRSQQSEAELCFRRLQLDMRDLGMETVDFRRLSPEDRQEARNFFRELRPRLRPVKADRLHPIPFPENGELWLLGRVGGKKPGLWFLSLRGLPSCRVFRRGEEQRIILTEDLLRHYARRIFGGEKPEETVLFRLLRNADVLVREELRAGRGDYRLGVENLLRRRRLQQPVRLVIRGRISPELLSLLQKELKLPSEHIFRTRTPFALDFDRQLSREPWMNFPAREPAPPALRRGEYMPYLRKKDLFLAFPFMSMEPLWELLNEAAEDPEVRSIKISLYRLSEGSRIVGALCRAARMGKEVLCLLELRARFDEQNNIDYSKILEASGCRVIYGLPGLKVHSKLCLVTRGTGENEEYFTQVGTGNYNETTGRLYTDISVITGRSSVGREAAGIFRALESGKLPPACESLWAAPLGYRERVRELIRRETARGPAGRITVKVNSLNDSEIMEELIRASRAGVRTELFVRGICCLRPGVAGKTDNITVKSIMGRYLEHSRIFAFGEGTERRIFIGSGDLLNRNTRRRVEVFLECVSPETREPAEKILDALRRDRFGGWDMRPDGSYRRSGRESASASQDVLWQWFACENGRERPAPSEKVPGRLRRLFGRETDIRPGGNGLQR